MNHEELNRVLDEDAAAVRTFMHQLESTTMAVAQGRYRLDPAAAEDVWMRVVQKLWDQDKAALRAWRGDGSLTAYLNSIVHRQCLMHLRARKVRSAEVAMSELDGLAAPEPPSPLDDAERFGVCRRAATQLSARDRRMLELRFFEERVYDEITQETGLTRGAARKAVHSAVRRLRDRVRREAPEYFAA